MATSPPEVMPASVEVAKPAPSKKEYLDMERLMEQFDDEFSNTLPKDDESVMVSSTRACIHISNATTLSYCNCMCKSFLHSKPPDNHDYRPQMRP